MTEDYEPKLFDVLKLLHPSIRQQGEQILHAIVCGHKILDWDKFLRVYYDGRPIQKSNITDLLDYILYPYDDDTDEPKGYDTFLKALAEIGLEPKWIENEKAREEIEEMIEDESSENESEEQSEITDEDTNDSNSENSNPFSIESNGIKWDEFQPDKKL